MRNVLLAMAACSPRRHSCSSASRTTPDVPQTLIDSFFSTGHRVVRPSRFVGLDNSWRWPDDPIFWQVLRNNLAFALGTIPTSDRAGRSSWRSG